MEARIFFRFLIVLILSFSQGYCIKSLDFENLTITDFTRRVFQRCPIRFGVVLPEKEGVVSAWRENEKAFQDYDEFAAGLRAFCDKQALDNVFNRIGAWAGKRDERLRAGMEHKPFVQKAVIPDGSEVFVCGDLHGSIYSLKRTLWRLRIQGYLGDDFKIRKPNFYMIFCGDYVDRGKDGCEVIYVISKLKTANWNNVFALRGNHEEEISSKKYGFLGAGEVGDRAETELMKKFGKDPKFKFDAAEKLIKEWYSCLPYALFLDNGTNSWIQCCHGGVEKTYAPKDFIRASEKWFQQLIVDPKTKKDPKDQTEGLNWSDVVIGKEDDTLGYKFDPKSGLKVEGIVWNEYRGRGWVTTVGYVGNYLQENGLKALIRGHADQFMWFKMFFSNSDIKGTPGTSLGDWLERNVNNDGINGNGNLYVTRGRTRYKFQLDEDCCGGNDEIRMYPNGPFNWRKVLMAEDLANPDGFLLSNYVPIYTLTNAYESRSLKGEEGYGIIHMNGLYENWLFKAYPYVFEDQVVAMDGKYIESLEISEGASEERALMAGSSQDLSPLLKMKFMRSTLWDDEAEVMQGELEAFLKRQRVKEPSVVVPEAVIEKPVSRGSESGSLHRRSSSSASPKSSSPARPSSISPSELGGNSPSSSTPSPLPLGLIHTSKKPTLPAFEEEENDDYDDDLTGLTKLKTPSPKPLPSKTTLPSKASFVRSKPLAANSLRSEEAEVPQDELKRQREKDDSGRVLETIVKIPDRRGSASNPLQRSTSSRDSSGSLKLPSPNQSSSTSPSMISPLPSPGRRISSAQRRKQHAFTFNEKEEDDEDDEEITDEDLSVKLSSSRISPSKETLSPRALSLPNLGVSPAGEQHRLKPISPKPSSVVQPPRDQQPKPNILKRQSSLPDSLGAQSAVSGRLIRQDSVEKKGRPSSVKAPQGRLQPISKGKSGKPDGDRWTAFDEEDDGK